MAEYTSAYTGAEIDANLAKAATATQPSDVATTISLAASAMQPSYTGNFTLTGNESISGNLTFVGTGQKVLGAFGSPNTASTLMFQNSQASSNTFLIAQPSLTGSAGAFVCINSTDGVNTSAGILICGGTDVTLQSRVYGTGTQLPLLFKIGTTERMRLDTNGKLLVGATSTTDTVTPLQVTGAIKSSAYTVATLPTGTAGCRAFVSDANATTFASIVAAGGANFVPVYHDGTNWRIG